MALTPPTMLPLGTAAPDFVLPAPGGRKVTKSAWVGAPALLVMFLCNHCPYVKHVHNQLARLVEEYQAKNPVTAETQ